MNLENVGSIGATIAGGFFVLIGYAIKKLIKIVAAIVGLFFSGLAYLQYEQIANVNWYKLQLGPQNAIINTNSLLELNIQ